MQVSEGKIGRVFVIRLEDGDILPDCLELFAEQNHITHGQVILLGGIGEGEIVVGPRKSNIFPPEPLKLPLNEAHEVVGVGVLASNSEGKPVLHIHGALGRSGQTMTGCLRPGVKTWIVGEVVLIELLNINAVRIKDAATGFTLLNAGIDPFSEKASD